ncbi:MAG: sugar phosphate nucleotidyltransferase [Anaerolineae bacterium]
MQGVILAAGKGSRLHPITTKRSKAMLPILGRPVVERVMETLWANGVREFILVVSPEDTDIRRYFREESPLEAKVEFVIQEKRLGMANALACAASLVEGDFILSACDNLMSADHIAEMMQVYQAGPDINGVMSLQRATPQEIPRVGVVTMNGRWITRVIEKPSLEEAPTNIATLPLYIFSVRLLDYLPRVPLSPRGEYEIQDAIQMLIDERGRVCGVFTDHRLDLTGPQDLLAINRHYLVNGHDQPQLAPFTVGKNTHLITPLRIEEGTTIGPDCVIGPRVYIERDCRIGQGVTIKDAVVLRESVIEDGAVVVGEVVS